MNRLHIPQWYSYIISRIDIIRDLGSWCKGIHFKNTSQHFKWFVNISCRYEYVAPAKLSCLQDISLLTVTCSKALFFTDHKDKRKRGECDKVPHHGMRPIRTEDAPNSAARQQWPNHHSRAHIVLQSGWQPTKALPFASSEWSRLNHPCFYFVSPAACEWIITSETWLTWRPLMHCVFQLVTNEQVYLCWERNWLPCSCCEDGRRCCSVPRAPGLSAGTPLCCSW